MKHYSNRSSSGVKSKAVPSSPDNMTPVEHVDVLESDAGQFSDVEDLADRDVSVVDDDDIGSYVEGDNIMYTTGEVASRLNISRDMARNHIRDFEEFLHISKSREGKYGHLSIRSTDMETLEQIVRLRKNRHSVEQVKQILRDPYLAGKLQLPTADYSELLEEAFMKNNTALLAEFQRIIDSSREIDRRLIAENSEKDSQIQSLKEEVDELRTLVRKQNQALVDQSDALKDQYDVIKDQTAAIESVKALLDEQASSKKKGFFGLFK